MCLSFHLRFSFFSLARLPKNKQTIGKLKQQESKKQEQQYYIALISFFVIIFGI